MPALAPSLAHESAHEYEEFHLQLQGSIVECEPDLGLELVPCAKPGP